MKLNFGQLQERFKHLQGRGSTRSTAAVRCWLQDKQRHASLKHGDENWVGGATKMCTLLTATLGALLRILLNQQRQKQHAALQRRKYCRGS